MENLSSRSPGRALAALAVLVALTGCVPGGAEGPGGTADAVGEHVGFWSEQNADGRMLQDAVAASGGLLLDGTGLTDLADGIDAAHEDSDGGTADLRAVDLDESVLVVAGYPSCQHSATVHLDDGVDPVRVWVSVTQDEPVDCAWSPYTVEVWALDRDQVGDDVVLVTS